MSWHRVLTIARHELTTQAKGPLFWALMALIAFLTTSLNPTALIPSARMSAEGAGPFINSPWALGSLFGLSGLFAYGLFAGIMVGMSVIRDDEAEISDILHATPLTASEYIVGKLGGVVTALGLVLAFQLVLAMAALQLMPVDNPETLRAPFRVSNYLVAALGFAAPTIWLFTALAFAVGERTRRPIVVFAVHTGLFLGTVFFFVTWRPVWLHPALDRLMMILDPSGLRWLTKTFFSVDRGIEFYNTASLELGATYWLNILVVIGLPLLAVLLSIRHCHRLISGGGTSPRRLRGRLDSSEPASATEVALSTAAASNSLHGLKMRHRQPGAFASALQMVGAELREFRNQPGLYVFTVLAVLLFIEPAALLLGPFDAPLLVTTGAFAVTTIDLITVLICLVLLIYTVEALGRERRTGLEPLLYATPPATSAS